MHIGEISRTKGKSSRVVVGNSRTSFNVVLYCILLRYSWNNVWQN